MRPGNDVGTLVLHSGKDVAKAIGITETEPDAEQRATEHLIKLFAIKSIDWKTQMVVYVGGFNQRNARLSKIEITKLDVNEKGVTVFWKMEENLRQVSPFISDTVLIPKVDGVVTFKQEPSKKANGEKETTPSKDRILPVIPGAPVK